MDPILPSALELTSHNVDGAVKNSHDSTTLSHISGQRANAQMGLVLITLLLITIGLELCLSHDNDKLVLDYAAELNERSVVLPPGLNGGELCFYQSVPSYWAGTWKIEAYHTAKSNPDVTLIVNGPYRDEEVTRGHPNREKPKPGKGIKAKVWFGGRGFVNYYCFSWFVCV